MFELVWAWRVLFGQIEIDDVPEVIRTKVVEILGDFRKENIDLLRKGGQKNGIYNLR